MAGAVGGGALRRPGTPRAGTRAVGELTRPACGVLLLAFALAWGLARPGWGGGVDATVRDDKGKPVEDAVVYLAPPAGAVPAARAARTATMARMDQWKQEFIPYVLAIEVGTAVSFPNKDNIRHHVYSFSSPKKFELPLYIGTPASPAIIGFSQVLSKDTYG